MAMAHPAHLIVFFTALLFFHTSEFLLALIIHGPSRVSTSSFLLSKQYLVAMVCGLVEYGAEEFFLPELKAQMWVSYTGLALVVLGEAFRKSAILTAEQNFTHDIKIYHRETHKLVTHGIYRFIRHPSYLGFFIWSVGTQILLINPICTVGYAIVIWRFFVRRIRYPYCLLSQLYCLVQVHYTWVHGHVPHPCKCACYNLPAKRKKSLSPKRRERKGFTSRSLLNYLKHRFEEYFLRQFFGKQYEDYAKKVSSGIPFVK